MSAPNQHRDVQARVLFCLPNLQPQRAEAPVMAGSRARQAAAVEPTESPQAVPAAGADRGSQPTVADSPTSRQNAAAMAFSDTSFVDPGSPNPPATPEISTCQAAVEWCCSTVESARSGGGKRFLTPLAIVVVVFAAWALGRQSASRPPVSDAPTVDIAASEEIAEQAVEEIADDSSSGAALAAAVATLGKRPGMGANRNEPNKVAEPNTVATAETGNEANAIDENLAVDETGAASELDTVDDAAVADGGFYLPEDADSLDLTIDRDDQLAAEIDRAAEQAAIAYRLAVQDSVEDQAEVERDRVTEHDDADEPTSVAAAKDSANDTESTVVQVGNQSESDAPDKTEVDDASTETATAEAKSADPAAAPTTKPQPRPRLSVTPNAVPDWSRYIPGRDGQVRAVSAESDTEDAADPSTETARQAIFLNEGPWADTPAIGR